MHWLIIFAPLYAAEEFGQAIVAEVHRRLVERGQDAHRAVAKLVERHAVGDDGVVVRPYRAAMVAERIEDALLAGDMVRQPQPLNTSPRNSRLHTMRARSLLIMRLNSRCPGLDATASRGFLSASSAMA